MQNTVVSFRNIPQGTLVKNTQTEKAGVVIKDASGVLSVCGLDEALVVYEGTNFGSATKCSDLEITGIEAAVADFSKCGAGKGAECCIFLTVSGGYGAYCERFGSLRTTLLLREMGAKRNPVELFPDCQIF